jgi:histidine ammonia-lyase
MFQLGDEKLTTHRIVELATKAGSKVTLTKSRRDHLQKQRAVIERCIQSGKTIYGINTGFGLLADVAISNDKLSELQVNLIRSHAIGIGRIIVPEFVRGLIISKAQSLSFGNSAISLETFDVLLQLLAHDVLPDIPEKGSVGASGDLAPLAHLALGMLGEGNVLYRGQKVNAKEALKNAGISAAKLTPKEGLSLINGTQFMATLGAFGVERAKALAVASDIAAAMSLDAIRGTLSAFDPRIQDVRGQKGQKLVAANIRALFASDDEIMNSHADCGKVQDPYSFRCVPQVHGASRDAIEYVEGIFNIELNAVTDNPLVFDEGEVLSGGNFHGQPLAISLDFLAIAVAELGSISERRIEKLTNPTMSGLPAFLTENSGVNSGFMIPHVAAAALVSENKVLAHPASVDSIPTSADKEDHVSMGPIAARKALEICENVAYVLAIEFAAACQGLDLLAPLKPSAPLLNVYNEVRKILRKQDQDQYIAPQIEELKKWIFEGGPAKAIAAAGVMIQ